MRVGAVPVPCADDSGPFEFGELTIPAGDNAAIHHWLQVVQEFVRFGCKKLRAMIELEAVLIACGHATRGAARFFEDDNGVVFAQFTGDDKAGQSGTDYGNTRHLARTSS